MLKLNNIICNNPDCGRICQIYIEIESAKGKLHYCSEQCLNKYKNNT